VIYSRPYYNYEILSFCFFPIVSETTPKNILEQYELAHIWLNDKKTGTWTKTKKLQSSVSPEILFIERCTQLLVPGGRMGIILPDSILGSPGLGYIREWLIRNHRIIASIDLHVDTFQPRNGTQTSVLFLQKKTQEQKDIEEKSGVMADYNVFMAMVEKIGHDKRGNPIFKRDQEGNEILISDTNYVSVQDEMGDQVISHEQRKKIVDDQTPEVSVIFTKWKIQEGIAW
ncbi:MAG: N-6 DNA methylase, partial [Lachnospiraceae bacterium]|nr:N-6 DNA methylase [Lachnospiraceae bacterium]